MEVESEWLVLRRDGSSPVAAVAAVAAEHEGDDRASRPSSISVATTVAGAWSMKCSLCSDRQDLLTIAALATPSEGRANYDGRYEIWHPDEDEHWALALLVDHV
jgi:hypothetical protein